MKSYILPDGALTKCAIPLFSLKSCEFRRHFVYLCTEPVGAGNNCSLVALGIHCMYLKPRDHESANHV